MYMYIYIYIYYTHIHIYLETLKGGRVGKGGDFTCFCWHSSDLNIIRHLV